MSVIGKLFFGRGIGVRVAWKMLGYGSYDFLFPPDGPAAQENAAFRLRGGGEKIAGPEK